MEPNENLWIAVLISLALGIVIGVVIARLTKRVGGGGGTGTQAQLEGLQLRFEEYQQEVASHFNTTASLVSKLNRSHQEMQAHLTQGAVELAPDEMTRQRLLAALEDDSDPIHSSRRERLDPVFDSFEPPRDYAPKLEDSPGTLSEEYGVKHKR
ncbi:DUF1043 family protein [Pseudomonas sp. gcc21]|uniref:YhcB family protein n=1 Tax=Pseudomonas sp. gcc21 TaxID=2726989 RepID=UPI001451A195|nr:DUF1043 family protein [Pseudomonas sp. gcc21]QJD59149.1 DUF1043 family protein [Pseudomonas sp. gcc21]